MELELSATNRVIIGAHVALDTEGNANMSSMTNSHY